MPRPVILFLPADPVGTNRLALDEECAAIERELQMTGRDAFDLRTAWATSIDDLMRHLNNYQPTVIHFSGHVGGRAGLVLVNEVNEGGVAQRLSPGVLPLILKTAAPGTRLVVLNACFDDELAEALMEVVDCVLGTPAEIGDGAARTFAVGFYRALGYHRSVANAFAQASATLTAKSFSESSMPRLRAREGVDAKALVLDRSLPPESAPAASVAIELAERARRRWSGCPRSSRS